MRTPDDVTGDQWYEYAYILAHTLDGIRAAAMHADGLSSRVQRCSRRVAYFLHL
jgi:hypothetical protein